MRHSASRPRTRRNASALQRRNVANAAPCDFRQRVLDKLRLKQPKNGIAYSVEQARLVAQTKIAAMRSALRHSYEKFSSRRKDSVNPAINSRGW